MSMCPLVQFCDNLPLPISIVFDMDPDLIREGGTIPIARTFQDVTGKNIIMIPIGGFDDGLHSQNEKISRFDSLNGHSCFLQMSNIVKPKPSSFLWHPLNSCHLECGI